MGGIRRLPLLVAIGLAFATPVLAAGGELDPTFAGNGRVITDFAAGSDDTARDVAVQPDGQVVVAGEMLSRTEHRIAVVRYTPDGSLDRTFGINGRVKSRISPTSSEGGNALALQSDGKILVAGSGNGDFVVARYNPDGSPDKSFGGDGDALDEFGNARDEALGLALRTA